MPLIVAIWFIFKHPADSASDRSFRSPSASVTVLTNVIKVKDLVRLHSTKSHPKASNDMKSLKNLNEFLIYKTDTVFNLPLCSLSSTFSHKAVNFLRPLFLQGFIFITYLSVN